MLWASRLRLVFWITLSSAVLSALAGHGIGRVLGGDGAAPYLRGAVDGTLTASILSSLEMFVLDRRLRHLPFLPHLALRSLAYLAIILLSLMAGAWLVPLPGDDSLVPQRIYVLFAFAVSVGYNLFFGINQLLGPGVLLAFVAGRYNRPRLEERVLLFIDMRSSTAIAERLGEVRFLDFLNRFVADLSLAITETGGEIHKYVGDEIIATWRLAAGLRDARAIRACFLALERLRRAAPAYEQDFGFAADFRAGLHSGAVVIGELGLVKMEIALLGDTMNTAARIQQACRDTGHRVLASAALIDRIAALPPGIACRALGRLPLRGKEKPIELYALEAAAAGVSSSAPAA
jgi:adenylate cyclase